MKTMLLYGSNYRSLPRSLRALRKSAVAKYPEAGFAKTPSNVFARRLRDEAIFDQQE